MKAHQGFYIVFEGIHGTGKTTQSKRLVEFLKNRFPKRNVVWTREPGGSEIAEAIRKLVQATAFTEEMDPICEAYLYAASRAQTIRNVVRPVLKDNGIVVQDNSFLTSLAYQGGFRRLGIKKILTINEIALDGLWPDMVIYLNLDMRIAAQRKSDTHGDKMEMLVKKYDEIVFSYRRASRLKELKNKWVTIKAGGEIEEVFYKIFKTIVHGGAKTETAKRTAEQPLVSFL